MYRVPGIRELLNEKARSQRERRPAFPLCLGERIPVALECQLKIFIIIIINTEGPQEDHL